MQITPNALNDLPRLACLDALRGLAALYVVAFHVAAMPEPDLALPTWLAPLVQMGGSGVALFFVLSAFSLCLTWHRHVATGLTLRSFYLSRLFRIAPLFIALLVLIVLKDQLRIPHRYSGDEVIWNLSMLFGLSADWQAGIVMGSWTIGVEMLFYAIFPLVIMLSRNLWQSVLLLVLSCVVAYLSRLQLPSAAAHLAQHMGILFQLPLFAYGCVIFQLWKKTPANLGSSAFVYGNGLLAIGVLGLLALSYGVLPSAILALIPGWYVAAVCYGIILLALLTCPTKLLVNRVTIFLGTISYSLYLTHPLVVSRLYPLFERAYGGADWLGYGLSLGASVALAVPVAWLSFRLIEKPGMALGKQLIARWRGSARANSIATE